MTGKEIFDKSMALIDEVMPTGIISAGDTEEYAAKAPHLLDLMHKELVRETDVPVPEKITSLNQDIGVNFKVAAAMAYGLAYNFMSAEGNMDMAGLFKGKFDEIKRESIKRSSSSAAPIVDVYGFTEFDAWYV